jgi:hypothetical protein
MFQRSYCDGIRRRNFVSAGTLGLLGLGLSDFLRWQPTAAAADGPSAKPAAAKSAIFIFLNGGPPHLDTFDMKPAAPAEYRGEFAPIATTVPGMEICELLPKLAREADKFALLRSVAHTQAEHTLGQRFLTTGNPPTPALNYPVYGSIVGRELPAPAGIPPFVSFTFANAIDNQENRVVDTAGYLGAASGPFKVKLGEAAAPGKGKSKSKGNGAAEAPGELKVDVRALNPPSGLSGSRLESRHELLRSLDGAFRNADLQSQDLEGMDRFYQQAYDMLRRPKAREAFDLGRERSDVVESYGRTPFGQSCLLARRLVEAGVRFVSINFGSWDAHSNIFAGLRGKLAELDAGVAGLLADLDARGLLDETAVLMTGEFGRTPKVNGIGGRDHWSRAMSVMMAGGGIQGGRIIGKTGDKGEEPITEPIKPEDVAVSFYRSLGIDPAKEYHTAAGRPIQLVRGGALVPELF